jgi:hypothetical protein
MSFGGRRRELLVTMLALDSVVNLDLLRLRKESIFVFLDLGVHLRPSGSPLDIKFLVL